MQIGFTGAFFFCLFGLCIVVLPGCLEVCVPTEEESLVFAGLTGAVLITVMGTQWLETRTDQTGLSTCISGDCLLAALAAS